MAGANTEIKMEGREPNQNGPQINQNQSHNPVNQHNTGRGGRGGGRGGFNHGGRKFQGSPGGRRDDGRGQKNPNQDGQTGAGDKLEGLPDEEPRNAGQQRGGPANRGGNRGFRGGGQGGQNDRSSRVLDDRVNDKLLSISGPTIDLPVSDTKEKKFAGRCRLYIGNLASETTEDEINQIFAKYGETSELFYNKDKAFAFIRMDYRSNAEKAKRELDGFMRKGRPLKVRFAPLGASVKVKNLTPWVSNELLELAFSVFGEIERCVIIVDERGHSQREGIIEFARKASALNALRKCSEGCFFLTASLRPVVLEPHEPLDDIDGYPEKNLPRKSPDYFKAREVGPRFAAPGSFEYEYGTRWKQLYELYKQKEEALAREMKMDEEKLEAQMEYARYEHETEILREQLRQRELDRERQKREWEIKERQAEEQRRADEEMMRRQQEEMQMRILHQEDELRRRQQENSIFMQEQSMRPPPTAYDSSAPDAAAAAAVREYEAMAATGAIPAAKFRRRPNDGYMPKQTQWRR